MARWLLLILVSQGRWCLEARGGSEEGWDWGYDSTSRRNKSQGYSVCLSRIEWFQSLSLPVSLNPYHSLMRLLWWRSL